MNNIGRILIIFFYVIFRHQVKHFESFERRTEDFLYWIKCLIKGRKLPRMIQSKRKTISLHELAGTSTPFSIGIIFGTIMLFILGIDQLSRKICTAIFANYYISENIPFLVGLPLALITTYYLKQDNLDRKIPILIRYEKRYGIRNFKIITWCYVITVFSPWILLWLISKLT